MRWIHTIMTGWLAMAVLALPAASAAAEPPKATLTLYGMTCQICEYALEKNLKRMKEVQKAHVDLIEGQAELLFRPGTPIDYVRLHRVVNDSGVSLESVQITAEGLFSRQDQQWFFIVADTDQKWPVQESEPLNRFVERADRKDVNLRVTGTLRIQEKASEPLLVIEQIH